MDALLRSKPIGNSVAIIGGGLTGIELAFDLVKERKHVEVIEMKDTILDMPDLCAANAAMIKTIIEHHKILVHTSAILNRIENNKVFYTVDNKENTLKVDTVITSIGYISDKSLYDTLKNKNIETYVIGMQIKFLTYYELFGQPMK